jgi:hypothetical protein
MGDIEPPNLDFGGDTVGWNLDENQNEMKI